MTRSPVCALAVMLCMSPALAGPLHDAVKRGDIELAAELIAGGEDVNEIDRNSGSPLHAAAIWSDAELAALLVDAGADVNAEHRLMGPPLNAAALKGNVGVAEILIANGADVNALMRDRTTALHAAAAGGSAAIVEMLVANGADVNARDKKGYGAVHSAGRKEHYDIIDLLRQLGATPPDIEPVAELLASADPEAGKHYFQGNCSGCHALAPDDLAKNGPPLDGVFERQKAAVEGFHYSPALQRLQGTWTVDEFNTFIASPTDFAPGTEMLFEGVEDPQMRANLIAYLQDPAKR
jgi:cytochrome c2